MMFSTVFRNSNSLSLKKSNWIYWVVRLGLPGFVILLFVVLIGDAIINSILLLFWNGEMLRP
jgi:hypothetical protein